MGSETNLVNDEAHLEQDMRLSKGLKVKYVPQNR